MIRRDISTYEYVVAMRSQSEAPSRGEWKRPMKRNPAYKGKWHAPMIDNPDYKGIWKPQQIPNPKYFELERPNLEPIAAIGIEIWTMQDGILFDNILIALDEKDLQVRLVLLQEENNRVKDELSAGGVH